MTKKEDHNIPKDYNKTIPTKQKNEQDVDIIVGSATPTNHTNSSKPKTHRIHHVSKRVIVIIGIFILVFVFTVGGLYFYRTSTQQAQEAKTIVADKGRDNMDSATKDEIASVAMLNVDVNDPELYFAKATALSKQDKNDDALRMLETLVKENPNVRYMYQYALIASRSGDSKLAVDLLQKTIELYRVDTSVPEDIRINEIQKIENKIQSIREEAGL